MAQQKRQAEDTGPASTSRVRLIVRRGAQRRFDALKTKAQELPVEVTWDRRRDDPGPSEGEGRPGRERRGTPPFTWELADFVVVTEGPDTPNGGHGPSDDDGGSTRAATPRTKASSKRS